MQDSFESQAIPTNWTGYERERRLFDDAVFDRYIK